MAANKEKVFSIKINGLTESIKAVDSLNESLKLLKANLNSLESTTINVGVQDVKKRVSTTKTEKTQAESAADQLASKNAKDLLKLTEQQTEAYQKQEAVHQRILSAQKNIVQVQKEIANGARNADGSYTNTIAGLRAELKEMTSILNTTELTNEEFEKYQARVGELNAQIKQLEQAHGDFRRNVGNYPSGTKELTELFRQTQAEIQKSTADIAELKDAMKDMTGAELDAANKRLDELEKNLADARKQAEGLNGELGRKIQVQVGDSTRYFDNTRQAVKELNLELTRMYMNGETDTKEFEDTIKALGKLKTAMTNVEGETKSYIGNMKGLNDAITVMQGMTGIAQVGVGLKGLFGGVNENVDESLAKFAQLSLVMSGLNQISKQMNDTTDIFGVHLRKVWDWLGNKIEPVTRKVEKGFRGMALSWINFGKAINNTNAAVTIDTMRRNIGKSLSELHGYFENFSSTFQQELGEDVPAMFHDFMESFTNGDIDGAVVSLQQLQDTFEYAIGNIKDDIDAAKASGNDNLADALLGDLDNWENASDKLNEAVVAIEDYGENIDNLEKQTLGASKGMAVFADVLKRIPIVGKHTGNIIQGIGRSVLATGKAIVWFGKAFAAAMKTIAASTVILLAVQLVMETLMKLFEWIGEAVSNKTVKAVDLLNSELERTNTLLERQIKLYELLQKKGMIGEWEKQRAVLELYEKELEKAGRKLQDFVRADSGEKAESLDKNLSQIYSWGGASITSNPIKNADEFRAAYGLLVKAVENGTDKTKEAKKFMAELGDELTEEQKRLKDFIDSWSGWEWWQTAGDAQDDLHDAQIAVLRDLEYQLKQINFSKPEQAVKDFRRLIDDEMYSSALGNIDNLDIDEQWRDTFKKNIEAVREFADRYQDYMDSIAEKTAETMRKIEDLNTSAMSNSWERGKAQRRLQYERDVRDAQGNLELIDALTNAYKAEEARQEKEHSKTLREIELDRQAMQIAAMKDGLKKRLAELQNQYERERLAILSNENKGQADLAQLYEIYQHDILEARKEYKIEYENFERERLENLRKLEEDYYKDMFENETRLRESAKDLADAVRKRGSDDAVSLLSFDVNNATLDDVRRYYAELLRLQNKYLDEQERAEKEALESRTADAYQEEMQAWEDRKREMKDTLDENLRNYRQYLDDGRITQKEYEDETKRLQADYDTYVKKYEEEHQKTLTNITAKGESDRLDLENDYRQQRQANNAEYWDNYLSMMEEQLSGAESEMQRNLARAMDRNTGIINYGKQKREVQKFVAFLEGQFQDIAYARAKLTDDYNSGAITFPEFSERITAINAFEKELKEKDEEISDMQEELLQNAIVSIANAVNEYISQLGNVWSMWNDIRQQEFDNLQEILDAEADALDREIDLLEDKYDKQADIVEKYTDRINDIEEQLSDARGDRREALIDDLAQERAKQLEALREQEQTLREQEALERQKEDNERRQDDLERKRKEQDKKDSLIQATISVASAIANALAVKPAWAGYALAGIMGALGAKQIATISAAKYANGGVLIGNSHAQGGIKVLGGTAEVEGGEYIVNKNTTSLNKDILDYINAQNRRLTVADMTAMFGTSKFAAGGMLPNIGQQVQNIQRIIIKDETPIVVSVEEIEKVGNHARQVRALAGLR